MIMFIVGLGIGAIIGLLAGVVLSNDEGLEAALSKERMQHAFNEAARLSRRIHRQREVIKTLKAKLPPQPRPAYIQRTQSQAH